MLLVALALLPVTGLELPAPTGPHPVGTRTFALVDATRAGPSGEPGRPLTVQLWYPAASQDGEPAPYASEADLLAWLVELEYYGQPASVIEGWARLDTHARTNLPLARDASGGPLPVLLFSHGLGVARMNYTALVVELASQGFAVAVVDHPAGGVTVCEDGTMLSTADDPEVEAHWEERCVDWAADHRAVLDALAERFPDALATTRAGVLGHSMGGAAALLAGGDDARLVACADLDGAPAGEIERGGLRRPSLSVKAVARYPGPGEPDDLAKLWAEMATHGTAPGLYATLWGTGHLSFSDAPFVMPDTITRFGGTLAPFADAHARLARLLTTFFDVHLRGGDPAGLLALGALEGLDLVALEPGG